MDWTIRIPSADDNIERRSVFQLVFEEPSNSVFTGLLQIQLINDDFWVLIDSGVLRLRDRNNSSTGDITFDINSFGTALVEYLNSQYTTGLSISLTIIESIDGEVAFVDNNGVVGHQFGPTPLATAAAIVWKLFVPDDPIYEEKCFTNLLFGIDDNTSVVTISDNNGKTFNFYDDRFDDSILLDQTCNEGKLAKYLKNSYKTTGVISRVTLYVIPTANQTNVTFGDSYAPTSSPFYRQIETVWKLFVPGAPTLNTTTFTNLTFGPYDSNNPSIIELYDSNSLKIGDYDPNNPADHAEYIKIGAGSYTVNSETFNTGGDLDESAKDFVLKEYIHGTYKNNISLVTVEVIQFDRHLYSKYTASFYDIAAHVGSDFHFVIPVITLIGNQQSTIEIGTGEYVDDGYDAIFQDVIVTQDVEVSGDIVNVDEIGTYIRRYDVSCGIFKAETVLRTVYIVASDDGDTTGVGIGGDPVITPFFGSGYRVKLPDLPGHMYRLLQGGGVIINAEIMACPKDKASFLQKRNVMFSDQKIIEGTYLGKVFIAIEDISFRYTIDLSQGIHCFKDILPDEASWDGDITGGEVKQGVDPDYKGKYTQRILSVGGGVMKFVIRIYDHPQVQNEFQVLKCNIDPSIHDGLLLKNYKPKLFFLNNLCDTRILSKHKKNKNPLTFRHPVVTNQVFMKCY